MLHNDASKKLSEASLKELEASILWYEVTIKKYLERAANSNLKTFLTNQASVLTQNLNKVKEERAVRVGKKA